jgi:hypothetical protein
LVAGTTGTQQPRSICRLSAQTGSDAVEPVRISLACLFQLIGSIAVAAHLRMSIATALQTEQQLLTFSLHTSPAFDVPQEPTAQHGMLIWQLRSRSSTRSSLGGSFMLLEQHYILFVSTQYQ